MGIKKPRPLFTESKWSPQQEAIFDWFARGEGNLVVRARAGTGKTTTILEGINRAPERKILMAAFNKSIATEMKDRLQNPNAQAKTLHSLGFTFTRKMWSGVRVEPGKRASYLAEKACEAIRGRYGGKLPMITDRELTAVAQIHTKCREIDPWAKDSDRVLNLAFQYNVMPNENDGVREWSDNLLAEAALEAMNLAAERTSEIDFADMVFLPLRNGWVRPWFDLVVVDEAQDMTVAQLAIAQRACKRRGRIAVVGDDRQAIYGFRGADSRSLDRLKDKLRARELGLNVTYRCATNIVDLARDLVPDYEAAITSPKGEIKSIPDTQMADEIAEGDFLISRTNAPLVKHCLNFLQRGIRAKVRGRDIGKSIIKLVDQLDAEDVDDLLEKLSEWHGREWERAQKIKDEDTRTSRVEALSDQREVIISLSEGVVGLKELRARMEDLFSDKVDRAAVMCSTVHKAKGLESDRIYLLRDTFRENRTEEANIKYVAITRAKTQLVWVDAPKED